MLVISVRTTREGKGYQKPFDQYRNSLTQRSTVPLCRLFLANFRVLLPLQIPWVHLLKLCNAQPGQRHCIKKKCALSRFNYSSCNYGRPTHHLCNFLMRHFPKQALTLGYQIDFLLERKHQELRDLRETSGTQSVLVRVENRLLVLSKREG